MASPFVLIIIAVTELGGVSQAVEIGYGTNCEQVRQEALESLSIQRVRGVAFCVDRRPDFEKDQEIRKRLKKLNEKK